MRDATNSAAGIVLRAVSILSLIAVAGCRGVQSRQSALDSVGPQAARIEWLWWFSFWVTLIVFVLVMSVLTTGMWKRHVREQRAPELQQDPGKEQRRVRVVIAVTGVTVLVLFVFLVVAVRAGKYMHAIESKNPITIEVFGHQWWWEVRYPSPDASQYFTTANEIHVPVGVPIVLIGGSRDVIHSFWAPNIHGKRDLIPGQSTAMWFRVDKEGTYRGQCAEFCGHQHAHMAFHIIAEPMDKFLKWREAQVQPAVEPTDPVAQRGKQVFLQGPCVMCHTVRGTPAGSRVGPDLTHIASRSTIGAGTLPNTRGALAGWIADSQSIKPGNRMPTISLPPDDLQALITYLQTLK